jgi:hypothetical protein
MALALVDDHPRPLLRVLPGGLDARPTPATYRRRRAVALVLAVVFVVVTMAGIRAVLRPLVDPPGGAAAPASAVGDGTVLVQPGETLWTIARDLQPTGDVRPLVDDLAALNGGSAVAAGQRLVLPASS